MLDQELARRLRERAAADALVCLEDGGGKWTERPGDWDSEAYAIASHEWGIPDDAAEEAWEVYLAAFGAAWRTLGLSDTDLDWYLTRVQGEAAALLELRQTIDRMALGAFDRHTLRRSPAPLGRRAHGYVLAALGAQLAEAEARRDALEAERARRARLREAELEAGRLELAELRGACG